MSDVDNPARDLAATGTPGPWELSKPASGDPWIERLKVTVTTTTDTPDQWVSVGGEPQ